MGRSVDIGLCDAQMQGVREFCENGASVGVIPSGPVHCGREGEVGEICGCCWPWLPLHTMVLWYPYRWAFVSASAAA